MDHSNEVNSTSTFKEVISASRTCDKAPGLRMVTPTRPLCVVAAQIKLNRNNLSPFKFRECEQQTAPTTSVGFHSIRHRSWHHHVRRGPGAAATEKVKSPKPISPPVVGWLRFTLTFQPVANNPSGSRVERATPRLRGGKSC